MNTFKTIMTIAGLLAIGFIAGFFTHRYTVQQRIEKVARLRVPRGFEERLFQMIDADAEQREQLQPIVAKYALRVAEEFREQNQAHHRIIDSMHQEIKPYLSDAQLERLERFHRRFRFREMGPPPPRDGKNRRRRENNRN